ncbi:MAG: hypothetical protein ACTH7Q_06290 [Pseudoalteromonas sp.]
MLIDYFIKKPNHKVTQLSKEMDLQQSLKRQHQSAFTYRLKRFAVTKVGLASAFSAGVGYQALKSDDKSSKSNYLSKFTWLLRLI